MLCNANTGRASSPMKDGLSSTAAPHVAVTTHEQEQWCQGW